jgi:hypothetical protein
MMDGAVGKHKAYPFATNVNVSKEMPIGYRPLPPNSHLVTPSQPGHYVTKPVRIGYRAPVFRIVEEEDLHLAGFRSYLTASGEFFNDVTILPNYDRNVLIDKFRRGLVEQTDGSMDASGLSLVEKEPDVTIEHPVISLASDEPANWGSWIYRVIPKLIEVADRSRVPVLTYAQASWMTSLLDLFFGNLNIIRHGPGRRYRLKQALVPSLRNSGVYFDDVTLSFYRSAAQRLGGHSPYEKIYLSRQASARKRPGFRVIENELGLIEALAERGFVAIELESLPIPDQIRAIRDAKAIVVPGGSGLFNCVFASNAERVIDIEPSRTWVHAHHSLLTSCGLDHTITFGNQALGSLPHSSWTIDIPAVIAALP